LLKDFHASQGHTFTVDINPRFFKLALSVRLHYFDLSYNLLYNKLYDTSSANPQLIEVMEHDTK